LNGITQEQFVINNPVCPSLTDLTACTGSVVPATPTIYQISSHLHAPYTLQSAISVERQLTKVSTLNVTYINSRGFDQLLTINAAAPYPGTPCSPTCAPLTENLYRYVSEAVFRQNQLTVNTNWRVGSKVQLFGYYILNYATAIPLVFPAFLRTLTTSVPTTVVLPSTFVIGSSWAVRSVFLTTSA